MTSKKDYDAIAKILKWCWSDRTEFEMPMIIERFANYFADDNPRFNKDKFIEACKQ